MHTNTYQYVTTHTDTDMQNTFNTFQAFAYAIRNPSIKEWEWDNTGASLTTVLQLLMGRTQLSYFNGRESVSGLLQWSDELANIEGVTKGNLSARLHAFEPRYVIAIKPYIRIHSNT